MYNFVQGRRPLKPPSFDEVNWDQLVTRAILGPEFQAAWETLKGSGISSTDATEHVTNLIRGSRSALRRFTFGRHGVWGLMRISQGNLIRLAWDETEEVWQPRPPRVYY